MVGTFLLDSDPLWTNPCKGQSWGLANVFGEVIIDDDI